MKELFTRKCRLTLACCGCLGLWSALMVGVTGCGGSDSSNSSVVPPPTPAVVDGGEPANAIPPGGIELPPGEIPSPAAGEPPKTEPGFQMPAGAKVPLESGAAARPDVKYATWEEIQTAARGSGRVTVVDLWSLACEPCLKEFPGLVRLHAKLGSSIQCFAVNLDFDGRKSRPPQYYEDQVVAFLSSVGGSGFPAYISQTPSDDVFAATKLASIPAVLVYDASGDVIKVFVDAGESAGFTYDNDVIPLVTKLAG